ncbi:hypothetical protein AV944_06645 [Sphingomonas sp. LK11]|jgi:hypothetical protein|uniref:hypothetical protein n=1 Tax=Sphingomonas sp. LK11 TaxID=1390395 RepID=UPI00097276A9|nr:hypothetical protein [Sphingomonas sp. LK11]APX65575.1 hypothetical protein AV944_06645 [Sphingomonas sp. LK11]
MRDIILNGLAAWLLTDLFLIIGATLLYFSAILPQPIGAAVFITSLTFAAASIGLTIFTVISVYLAIAVMKKGGAK